MSQPDWEMHPGTADHQDIAELPVEADLPTDSGERAVAGEPVVLAGEPAGDASSGEAEQPAGATSRDQGISGWSGRAIGPLSGLLPGGAVDRTVGEMPVEQLTSAVGASDHQLASAGAGTNGDEPQSGVPVADRGQAAEAGADENEPAVVLATDEAQPDDGSLAAQSTESALAAEAAEPGLTSTDDRWHAVLVGFVDDPRGSVEAAAALIDADIASHIALLARRRDVMHAAWQSAQEADTEALRVALVSYRDLRKRLADVVAG